MAEANPRIIAVEYGLPVVLMYPFLAESLGDIGIVQMARHFSHSVDDFGRISHTIRHIGWKLDEEVRAGISLPANVRQKLLRNSGFLDRNVLDEQSQHPLAIFGCVVGACHNCGRCLQVRGLSPSAQGSRHVPVGAGIPQLVFEFFQLQQGCIPTPFQSGRHQAAARDQLPDSAARRERLHTRHVQAASATGARWSDRVLPTLQELRERVRVRLAARAFRTSCGDGGSSKSQRKLTQSLWCQAIAA